jgi:hypothetical protein
MGLFSSSAPKRVTKEEFIEIQSRLYGKLDEEERVELEKFFRADLYEAGTESGITRLEFESGMEWLRNNSSKHKFESDDLVLISKFFEENLQD